MNLDDGFMTVVEKEGRDQERILQNAARAHRVIVAFKDGEVDAVGKDKRMGMENFLKINVDSVRTRRVYTIDAELTRKELASLVRNLFVDPVTEVESNK